MTVIATSNIPQRIWRGYDDPGLPVGMYLASQTVLGDVSGGNQIIQFIYRDEGEAVSGRFYNIEQLDVMTTGSAASGFLQSINFESVGPTGLVNFERRIRVLAQPGTFGNSIVPNEGFGKLPLFLGSPQALVDLAGEVDVGFANVDGVTLAVSIQGYIWGVRSIMAEGGLRRPVDSLYG